MNEKINLNLHKIIYHSLKNS